MKINILLAVVLSFFCITFCCDNEKNKQRKSKEIIKNVETMQNREKFDIEFYEKIKDNIPYIRKDGSRIYNIGFDKNTGGAMSETFPPPSFLSYYKEFYPNAYIKKKETFLGEYTKVGISEYYDEKGNKTTVDEDKKFGKIKPDYILKFLEKKGYINLKTGTGRFIDNMWNAFEIIYEENINLWIIEIKNGKPFEGFPEGIGEPSGWMPIYFYIDGDSGELMPEDEFEKREKSTYKVYDGKKYSYKEWKTYEEAQYQEYLKKKNGKGFWDKLFGD